MPSPFPGMDPYLENQEWEDFHTRFNTNVSESLVPILKPRYIVRIERRVYIEHALDSDDQQRRADVAIVATGRRFSNMPPLPSLSGSSSRTALAPVELALPMPLEHREAYIVIRERESMEVVTLIETLSPTNKTRGGPGRDVYLSKREEILQSRSHLVELDLLRAGARLPVIGDLPAGDYYALVSRTHRRFRAQVYAWTIRDALPTIPIPLKAGDPDVGLDLQAVFTSTFDRADYRLSLDYTLPLAPPLADANAAWVKALLEQK